MDPYDRMSRLRNSGSALVASIASAIVEPAAEELGKLTLESSIPISAGFIQLGVALVVWAMLTLFAFPWLEDKAWYRKAVLRKLFVEGAWFATASPKNVKSPKETTSEILLISYSNGNLRITGTVYSKTGDQIARFESEFYKFNWPILYHQVVDLDVDFDQRKEGLAEIQFYDYGNGPLSYGGSFGHVGIKNTHDLNGFRIKDCDLSLIDDPIGRRDFIKTNVQRMT